MVAQSYGMVYLVPDYLRPPATKRLESHSSSHSRTLRIINLAPQILDCQRFLAARHCLVSYHARNGSRYPSACRSHHRIPAIPECLKVICD